MGKVAAIGIERKFTKLPNSIVLFESLTFSIGRDISSHSCYLLLNLIFLDIQSSDFGVVVVPLLNQSSSLSAVLFVLSLKYKTQN